MALTSGDRLGPYEIVSPLGAGGMGEVYRARDTRLDRVVAIKVLPEILAGDAQFRERFEREARTISQLAHPHICMLFDVGQAPGPERSAGGPDSVRFLVMEFLEGESLSERIARGPLSLGDALAVAIGVASALDCAHRAGVVHRDLKPGNIFLVRSAAASDPPTAKLLDFGLAKSSVSGIGSPVSAAAPANLSAPPTMTTPLTGQGTIIGTFQYMSPEQLEGKDVDARADTFAFGAVLFEMLAGRRAFQGKTQFTVMGAILEHDPPPISTIVTRVPPALDRIVQKCLAKDPAKRWQSMADLADELKWIAEQASAAGRATARLPASAAATPSAERSPWSRRRWIVGVMTGMAIAAVSAIGTWGIIRLLPTARRQPVHFTIVPPSAQPLSFSGPDRDVAISPDGTQIVYRAGNASQLMVRAIDQIEARPLGDITVRMPFISADSHWVGFFAAAALQKVSIAGGPPVVICQVPGAPRGASWGSNDTIIFGSTDPSTGLLQVPAGGGDPHTLTTPDVAHGESDHVFPSFLPGGRAVLFTITSRDGAGSNQVAVLDLDSGARKTLVRGGSNAEYVAPPTASGQGGYLVYAANGTLRAVRFDPSRLEVIGDAVPVVDRVMIAGTGAANYAVSRTGTLLYVPGSVGAAPGRSLVWVDRQGREQPLDLPSRAYLAARLSPDGTRIALDVRDPAEGDIWIWDFSRRTLTRLTFDPAADQYPIWTPDGRRIVFASARIGGAGVYWQVIDGTGTAERLTEGGRPNSISPDGTQMVMTVNAPKTGTDLYRVPLTGPRRAEPLIVTPFAEINADISPDGKWIAYQSNESGRDQVFVRPFPNVDSGRWQVSSKGGTRPVWARTGRELFYLEDKNSMAAVPVQTSGSTFSAGNPVRLFEGRYFSGPEGRLYDVARDGQRFLLIKDALNDQPTTPASMVVVLDWTEELKRLVPTR